MGSGGGDEFIYSPAETARNTTGVVALEWTRDGVTVLAFRGSLTTGDVGNIGNWFLDYVLERSTARMKQAWTADAGLTWTDTMQERHDRGDLFARTAIRAQSSYTAWDGSPNSGKFAPELATAVRESADSSLASLGLDEAAAKATGYWALTKKMVDDVVDALPTGQAGGLHNRLYPSCVHAAYYTCHVLLTTELTPSTGQALLLTGHSQGATRAQYASMYLAKSRGTKYTAVTFASTGGACAARLMCTPVAPPPNLWHHSVSPHILDYTPALTLTFTLCRTLHPQPIPIPVLPTAPPSYSIPSSPLSPLPQPLSSLQPSPQS